MQIELELKLNSKTKVKCEWRYVKKKAKYNC